MFQIVVVDGKSATIDVRTFSKDHVVIGRVARTCDLVLSAGNVAKRHATLTMEGPERLVVTGSPPNLGGVLLDGQVLMGSRVVAPYEPHRLTISHWSLFLTEDVEGTINRQRELLDGRVATATLAHEVAVQRQRAQRQISSLPAADAVVLADGHGWRTEDVILFRVVQVLKGSPTPGEDLQVLLDPAWRALVGLKWEVPRPVADAFPSLDAQFGSPWLLHLRRPDGPGQPWHPVDPVLGVLPARPELVALARRQ